MSFFDLIIILLYFANPHQMPTEPVAREGSEGGRGGGSITNPHAAQSLTKQMIIYSCNNSNNYKLVISNRLHTINSLLSLPLKNLLSELCVY